MDVKMEALKLLKQLFTKQVFADAKLTDGTIVSAEAFEPGQDLFIIDEAGERLVAPDGEHTLEDGTKVMVEGGKIKELIKQEMEDGIEEKVDITEEEMAVEVEIEPYVEEVPEKEDEIQILKAMVDELMGKVSVIEEEMGKMKMSSDEKSEALKDAVVELSENFSKIPAAEKLDLKPGEFESKFSKISKTHKKQDIHDWLSKNKK
jgi:hypothetical protein